MCDSWAAKLHLSLKTIATNRFSQQKKRRRCDNCKTRNENETETMTMTGMEVWIFIALN